MTAQRRYLTDEAIEGLFGFHGATEVTGPVHDSIRHGLGGVAVWFNNVLPEGPLKTEAIGLLRKTMYSANAAVAVYAAEDSTWTDETEQALRKHGPQAFHLVGLSFELPEQRRFLEIDIARLARLAYAAYGETTDYKNYQGLPMPAFDDLPVKIREAWNAAAVAVGVAVQQAMGQGATPYPQESSVSDPEGA